MGKQPFMVSLKIFFRFSWTKLWSIQEMVYSSLNLAKIFDKTIINRVLIGHSLKWYHWLLTKRNKLETNHFVFK